MSRLDEIRAAVLDVLHAGQPDRPWPTHEDECERCGATDGDLVEMISTRTRGTMRAHQECGEAAGYELVPACTGADDLCGAPAGTLCAPGCPSRATDPGGAL